MGLSARRPQCRYLTANYGSAGGVCECRLIVAAVRSWDDAAVEIVIVGGGRFAVTRARESDVLALVELLSDDVLGKDREFSDLDPYFAAFTEIDEDPHQLLVAVRDDAGVVVGTMQLTLLPGLARGGAKRLQIEAVRLASSVLGGGLGLPCSSGRTSTVASAARLSLSSPPTSPEPMPIVSTESSATPPVTKGSNRSL